MIDIVNALLPVFLIIALGQLLTRVKFVGAELWAPLDRIVYFILFPALLLRTLANADLGGLDIIPMAAALLAAIFTMVGLHSTLTVGTMTAIASAISVVPALPNRLAAAASPTKPFQRTEP